MYLLGKKENKKVFFLTKDSLWSERCNFAYRIRDKTLLKILINRNPEKELIIFSECNYCNSLFQDDKCYCPKCVLKLHQKKQIKKKEGICIDCNGPIDFTRSANRCAKCLDKDIGRYKGTNKNSYTYCKT